MSAAVLAMLLAQGTSAAPTPTPTPTPPINLLVSKQSSEAPPPTQSLGDVAKKIKLRLPADKPRVLTNASVKTLAQGVELTTSMVQAEPTPLPGQRPDNTKKALWQDRYKAAVARASQMEAEITRLTGEVARLETAFYSTDDPAQRDGVIKPAWDKALTQLRTYQAELETARSEPEKVLDAARRDGAEPGWFRGLDEAAANMPSVPLTPQPTPTPTQRKRTPD